MNKLITCATGILSILLACSNATHTQTPQTLAEARRGFTTKIIKQAGAKGPVEVPPDSLFHIVQYPSAPGNMAAYLGNIPKDGQLHPAIIWITGGFGNDIGDFWTPQDSENDQSAAVFRQAGIVMMYPSQRGGNMNAGTDESFYGEIDDILAAAAFLAKQPGIDPNRIYLGGHSTGGTKVLLAAECSNMFRAVFAFGPVGDVRGYGEENATFDMTNEKESLLRAPIRWLSSVTTPVYVFEGEEGNLASLMELKKQARMEGNRQMHFYIAHNAGHFSILQPVGKMIAQKILADTETQPNISFDQKAIDSLFYGHTE